MYIWTILHPTLRFRVRQYFDAFRHEDVRRVYGYDEVRVGRTGEPPKSDVRSSVG